MQWRVEMVQEFYIVLLPVPDQIAIQTGTPSPTPPSKRRPELRETAGHPPKKSALHRASAEAAKWPMCCT